VFSCMLMPLVSQMLVVQKDVLVHKRKKKIEVMSMKLAL